MKIDILTLFPEMFTGFLNTSIIKRAIDKGLVTIELHDFREFSIDKHKHVDDYPYGGGQGMVLMCAPIVECLKTIATDDSFIILMSPQGITLNHGCAVELSAKKHLIIICGHYEGFDERIRDYVDMEFGTGVVKITPAHDPNDYEVGRRHNLPILKVMNDDATMTEACGKYAGMERYAARKAIVKDLEEQGYVVKLTAKQDRRFVYLMLTQEGQAVLCQAKHAFFTAVHEIVQMLGQEDSRELLRLLRRIAQLQPAERGYATRT